jgi:hypothetical protein
MSDMTVRRGVVAGLGAAAGALAAAAFLSNAPIAGADNGNGIDWGSLASPAPVVTFPELTYTDTVDVYSGTSGEEYITTYDGSGSPVTTMDPLTVPTGDTEYGVTGSYEIEYLTSATAGYEDQAAYALADLTTATGVQDYFEPLVNVFSSF